jgi:hypothetical protein
MRKRIGEVIGRITPVVKMREIAKPAKPTFYCIAKGKGKWRERSTKVKKA